MLGRRNYVEKFRSILVLMEFKVRVGDRGGRYSWIRWSSFICFIRRFVFIL